jgi:hypothetical protein
MEVTFSTVEELAEAMYALARVLETDGEQLAQRMRYMICKGTRGANKLSLRCYSPASSSSFLIASW